MEKSLNKFYCAECGGTNIQAQAWVDPNTKEFIDFMGMDDEDNCWCDTCEDHTELLTLQELWKRFEGVPVNNDDEIEEDFMNFEAGTSKFDVWHWFDERCPNGLAIDLMGEKPKNENNETE